MTNEAEEDSDEKLATNQKDQQHGIYEEKAFPSNQSETDGLTFNNAQTLGNSPRNALAVLRQRTPFKNKKTEDQGRNETSVEVLILDGSEFVSQSETAGMASSQNVPTEYDESGQPLIRVTT